jgi:methylmalonyl-CoA mutase cobalamin-binding domain/chain
MEGIKMDDELVFAMENLDEEMVLNRERELRQSGMSANTIMDMLNQGMLRVGKLFESGRYYLADLIVSGTIYQRVLEQMEFEKIMPREPGRGRVLIGVVKNDIHDIGKDIIAGTLRSEGFEIIDLGTDVTTGEFIEAIRNKKPDILALGGTMSYALDEMETIINRIKDEGLRDGVVIVVGGVGLNQNNANRIGADFYGADPVEAAAICKRIISARPAAHRSNA